MATLPADSVDAIVCDPPYGLSFMGKGWDHGVPGVDFWVEALRVLKPGGHLIAFGGTRTYHRLAVAIEDAGFEVRDCLMWLYGSGFPKSLDVSKAMDKKGGASVDFTRFRDAVIDAMKRNKITRKQLESALGNYMLSHYLTAGSQPAVPNYRDYCIIRDAVCLGSEFDELFNEPAEREVLSSRQIIRTTTSWESSVGMLAAGEKQVNITAPTTDVAKAWHGWGTALKPAYEPAILARKPLRGTVADNVAQWGTGGLNIDGCRVPSDDGFEKAWDKPVKTNVGNGSQAFATGTSAERGTHSADISANKPTGGRWPANVILDEEAAAALDAQSGVTRSSKPNPNILYGEGKSANDNIYGKGLATSTPSVAPYADTGGASRFFYTAKASRSEREAGLDGVEQIKAGAMTGKEYREDRPTNHPMRANHHPTVKPVALMRYMIRLVAPRGAVVLDPFMGSGSTGCAAMVEGMQFVGIDITPEYVDIARRRLAWWSCSLDGNAIIKTEEYDT
jgi:DNA modification methylase